MRLLLVALSSLSLLCTALSLPHRRWPGGHHWVDLWTAMPQLTEAANLPPAPFNGTNAVFVNSTIRQTLHMSLPADQLRIRVSNAFGTNNLTITGMTVARPAPNATSAGSSLVQTDTIQKVTFSGGDDGVVVPDMALAVSDPVQLGVAAGDSIAVTMYLASGQQGFSVTSHPGSRVDTWIANGDQTSSYNLTGAQTVAHWYFVSAVEGWLDDSHSAFAIVGDSITDGRGSTTDANNRWPDLLNARMQQAGGVPSTVAVVNLGAGGNRILNDGLGPNAYSRIGRDVLAQSGVKYAMIFEGVNDIGTADTTAAAQQAVYDSLIAAYQQIITQVHTMGLPIFAATITPFSAPNSTIQPYSDPTREQTRLKVNDWIKTSGRFDYVVDFASVVANPQLPERLADAYDSGDYLHPNVAGYEKMAAAFDLGVFERFAGGVAGYN